MPTMIPWLKELVRLDEAIRQIAKRPVDLDNLDSISKGAHPLDEVGVRAEAQALLLEILRALESATEEERRSILAAALDRGAERVDQELLPEEWRCLPGLLFGHP